MALIDGKQISPNTVTSTQILHDSSATAIVDIADAQTISGAKTFSATTTFNGNVIVPSTPASNSSAASKLYVDSVAQGITCKTPSRAATTAALPSVTYANGSAGIGATLTATANGAFPVTDGVTLVANDRILVKDQAASLQNGIYTLTTVGSAGAAFVLTRATDFDDNPNPANVNEIVAGSATFIEEGTLWADMAFVLTTPNPITVGTTGLTFVQFTGTGQIVAGNGLTKTGNRLDVNPSDASLTVSTGNINVHRDSAGALGLSASGIAVNTDGTSIDISGNNVEIKNLGVTTAKIADLNVTTAKINDLAVTTAKLADASVTTVKIADANVTLAKLAANSVDENKIVSTTYSGTGAITGGSGTKVSVNVDASSVKISSNNLVSGQPASADKDRLSAATTADFQTTGLTITNTPAGHSFVGVNVNGMQQRLGNGVRTRDCYFSADGGSTARALSAIVAGDTLYWVGSVAGYQLATTDTIDMDYNFV